MGLQATKGVINRYFKRMGAGEDFLTAIPLM
jgi:hypothetical protein